VPSVSPHEQDTTQRPLRHFRVPSKSPACGARVARDEHGVYIRCLNPSCPAQLKERLRFFAARGAMDIAGLGPALIDQLVDRGLVRSLPDLYRLSEDQFVGLEHIGRKSAQKLLNEIAASKKQGLTRVLIGLGIRHVGDRTARLLADEFGSIGALTKASGERLASVPGVGPVAGQSVHEFLHSAAGRQTVQELRRFGVKLTQRKAAAKKAAGRLAGETLVVTGTLSHFGREEAEGLIADLGGKPASSVSRNTDYVVAGRKPGSK